MARLCDNVIPGYLFGASALATAPPFTMAGWFYLVHPGGTNGAGWYASIQTLGSNNQRWTIHHTPGDIILFRTRTTSNADAVAPGLPLPLAWNHVAAVETSTTSHACFLNGAKGTSTTSKAPSGVNETVLGAQKAGALQTASIMAHWCFWNVALTDAEVLGLYQGIPPNRVRPSAVIAYYPLDANPGAESPWETATGTLPLTSINTTVVRSDSPVDRSRFRKKLRPSIFMPAVSTQPPRSMHQYRMRAYG